MVHAGSNRPHLCLLVYSKCQATSAAPALCSTLLVQSTRQCAGTGAQLDKFVSTPACSAGQPTHHECLVRIRGDRLLGQVLQVLLKQGSKGFHPFPLPTTIGVVVQQIWGSWFGACLFQSSFDRGSKLCTCGSNMVGCSITSPSVSWTMPSRGSSYVAMLVHVIPAHLTAAGETAHRHPGQIGQQC